MPPEKVIIVREPETEGIKNEVSQAVTLANNLVVDNDKTLNDAAGLGREIKRRMTLVREKFKDMVDAAHAAHKKSVALRDEIINPLKEAETTIKSKMSTYQLEQERIRRQAEEAARKERERVEEEARKKHEEELKKAEKEAEDKQLKDAETAAKKGDTEKSEGILDSEPETEFVIPPTPTVAAPVMPEAAKPKGTSFLKKVRARIVHEDSVPREFCSPDIKKLEAYGKALGKNAKVNGVLFWEEVTTKIRK